MKIIKNCSDEIAIQYGETSSFTGISFEFDENLVTVEDKLFF